MIGRCIETLNQHLWCVVMYVNTGFIASVMASGIDDSGVSPVLCFLHS